MTDGKIGGKAGGATLLLGTMKGAFVARESKRGGAWKLDAPIMLGTEILHIVADPRVPSGRTMVMGARTGHMGPTAYRSADGGATWTEASRPPAFPKVEEADTAEANGKKARAVSAVFWISPGHASEPGVWYAGTIPHGLFRSEDGGDTWDGVAGFNDHPDLAKWRGEGDPPGGPYTHSIIVDPRDAKRLYLSMSIGGFFESLDRGATWAPINAGCEVVFGPELYPEFGQDPHCTAMAPSDPGRFYQQNHCGIYRMDRAEAKWHRIGRQMPAEVGDIGFPVVVHPRDADTAWVFPMDGSEVWPRTSPGGRAAVYRTRDAGATWQRQDAGLPQEHGYLTVMRQAMSNDARDPVGLFFGTTTGELWVSDDEGASWRCVAQHLPRILSVEVVAGK